LIPSQDGICLKIMRFVDDGNSVVGKSTQTLIPHSVMLEISHLVDASMKGLRLRASIYRV